MVKFKAIMYKLIIFDLDGTLVDAYQPVASSLNFTLTNLGYDPVDDETIKRSVGWGDRNLVSRFVEEGEIDEAISIYREHHKEALKSGTKFLPGAKKLLKTLKADGYRLAIASNRPTRYTHIILKHLHINHTFDEVLCADKIKNPKPSGDILRELLKRFSLETKDALYVGDMTIDAETGQDADVQTIIVLTGSSSLEEVQKLNPHSIIDNVYKVANILA